LRNIALSSRFEFFVLFSFKVIVDAAAQTTTSHTLTAALPSFAVAIHTPNALEIPVAFAARQSRAEKVNQHQ
jgi:hypothetical protein